MTALHGQIAMALVLYYVLVGLWGLGLGLAGRPVDSSYRGALYLAIAVAAVQVVTGVALLLVGLRPRDDLHPLYGLSLLVTLPVAHQYLARRWRPPLAYGLACLFMAGLAVRGITTGR